MSRIGLSPILIPEGVTINVSGSNVNIKGPKGELNQKIDSDFKIKIDESTMILSRPSEQKRHKSLHGLYRSLINNCVIGVSEVLGRPPKREWNFSLVIVKPVAKSK